MDLRIHYLDASAIAKFWMDEPGSAEFRTYIGQHPARLTTSLCLAETLGVLKAKWQHGRITREQYLIFSEELMAQVREGMLEIVDVRVFDRSVFDEAETLCERHDIDLSDSCQLVILRSGVLSQLGGESRPILVTADRQLASAARKEGLRVWDCVHETAP